jgi:hypothetical protein
MSISLREIRINNISIDIEKRDYKIKSVHTTDNDHIFFDELDDQSKNTLNVYLDDLIKNIDLGYKIILAEHKDGKKELFTN